MGSIITLALDIPPLTIRSLQSPRSPSLTTASAPLGWKSRRVLLGNLFLGVHSCQQVKLPIEEDSSGTGHLPSPSSHSFSSSTEIALSAVGAFLRFGFGSQSFFDRFRRLDQLTTLICVGSNSLSIVFPSLLVLSSRSIRTKLL